MLEFIDAPWQVGIGIIGTAASLASAFLAESNWKSRAVHVCYTGAIVLLIFYMTSYNSRLETELSLIQNEAAEMLKENDELRSIRSRAAGVYSSMYHGSDQGENRGNVLQAISFLETYSDRYPRSLELLLKLANGAGVTERSLYVGDVGYNQQRETLEQAGDAARQLVQGVASGG